VKALLRRLTPYRARVRLRALLDGPGLDPSDVVGVQRVTTEQWRTIADRAPHYAEVYWGRVDDPAGDTVEKRRSEWLARLEPFREARSVLELGCNVGRNLFVLQQSYPALSLTGMDINRQSVEYAQARVRGDFLVGDLYEIDTALGDRTADVIFTMGVLIHLHPATLPKIVSAMACRARRHLVLVEQVSRANDVVKGPASWNPERRVTGDYIQWSPDLSGVLDRLGLRYTLSDVPEACQSNGARHLLVVTKDAS
jgi:SAM-dependent methyltransferase